MNLADSSLPTFLTVQGNQYACGIGALGLNDLHDFTNGGTRRDHVVDNQNIAFKCRADQTAAFAVSFGFLAVETPRHVAFVVFSQRNGGGRCQRNTFVRRAKQHVEGNTAVYDRGSLEPPQLSQRRTGVEQAGIEEVRTGTPGLQGELTEAQNAGAGKR